MELRRPPTLSRQIALRAHSPRQPSPAPSRHTPPAPSQQTQHLGGTEVILYSFIRPHDTPVAKATILSTSRMAIVDGTPLGPNCCEVVVNHVLKKTAPLLCPYGDMKTLVDAIGRSIAWPRQHIKEYRKSLRKHQDGSHDLCGQNFRST